MPAFGFGLGAARHSDSNVASGDTTHQLNGAYSCTDPCCTLQVTEPLSWRGTCVIAGTWLLLPLALILSPASCEQTQVHPVLFVAVLDASME